MVKTGNAKAWLAHIDLLKYVIQSGFASALIFEDDVDWDVRIKDQMLKASRAIRNFTKTNESDPSPYGTGWDVLFFGHCGEICPDDQPVLRYEDETAVPPSSYVYEGGSTNIRDVIHERERIVQPSTHPVCTYAYAVTAASAPKVVQYVSRGGQMAMDLKLMVGCIHRELNCISINPEIFRAFVPDPDLGESSDLEQLNNMQKLIDGHATEVRGTTVNVAQSARCQALFGTTCQRTKPR